MGAIRMRPRARSLLSLAVLSSVAACDPALPSPGIVEIGRASWTIESSGNPFFFSAVAWGALSQDGRRLVIPAAYDSRILSVALDAGDSTFAFGSKGGGPGEMRQPGVIGVAPNGDVLVTDLGLQRISRFNSAGHYVDNVAVPVFPSSICTRADGFLIPGGEGQALRFKNGQGFEVVGERPRTGGKEQIPLPFTRLLSCDSDQVLVLENLSGDVLAFREGGGVARVDLPRTIIQPLVQRRREFERTLGTPSVVPYSTPYDPSGRERRSSSESSATRWV